MIRTPPRTPPGARSAAKAASSRVVLGLRALVAAVITVLQLASALHFTLVPHTFSAALGGVVHVHGESAAPRARGTGTPALVADTQSCAVDRCPFADAPPGSAPCGEATLSGSAAFGAPGLLSEQEARVANARRVFLSAPKTSPPV